MEVFSVKVLAISSSPRKGGNSDVLCDEFLRGAAENGHETRKIRLAEKKNRAVRGLLRLRGKSRLRPWRRYGGIA